MTPHTARPLSPSRQELEAVVAIAAANLLLNRPVHPAVETVRSLIAAGSLVSIAAGAGATAEEQGISLRNARAGARLGVAVGIPLACMLLLGALASGTRRFYGNPRILAADAAEARWQLLVRIPFATALGEELMFRSALESLFTRRRPRHQARLATAFLFGLWHILPTLNASYSRPAVVRADGESVSRRVGVAVATAGVTFLASLAFSSMRDRTRSVLAPAIAHYAVNAGGYIGARLFARRSQRATNAANVRGTTRIRLDLVRHKQPVANAGNAL